MGIPILFASGRLSFEWLIVLVVLGAFFDGPGATAKDAMVPELAEAAGMELDRVNAFFQGSRRLSIFIGPAVAGFLIAIVGTSNVLWVNAVVFALSALLTIVFIPAVTALADADHHAGSFWQNTLFGFRFIREHRLMLWLACIVGLMNFLDAPLTTVTLPALVSENYGAAAKVGLLLSSHGAGAVLGTILFSAMPTRFSRRRTFITGFLAIGIGYFALAAVPPYPLALAAMLAMGLIGSPINPILMSIRQELVPMPYRARVFGTTTAIAFVAIPLGQLIGGYAIEWIGVQPFIFGVAVVYLAAVISFAFAPALREMDALRAAPGTLTAPRPAGTMPAETPPTRAEEPA
jgi:MFS family permease